MFEIKEKPKMVERAMLLGLYHSPEEREESGYLLEELGQLVDTLGIPVYDRQMVHVRQPQARFLMGTGKAEEIANFAKEQKLDILIFDNELTPAQQRNWEKLTGMAVIDREEVILDIFGKRAHTKEARLQVDLARMEYSLPRLTRAWSHFGQQAGGIGGKGEGESQLELDKRMVRTQIERLRKDLAHVRRVRATQRKERKRVPVPNAAIVGYTNAGKSSLLRRFTSADVLVEDKLFATLDTTTRRVALPNKQPLLLTDTVGFVRKLPHGLVEAFKATLEESVLADFLIHLLDASHPEVYAFHHTTMNVLKELKADTKKTLTVLNKIDRVKDESVLTALRLHFPDAIFISVHTGEGLDLLLKRMSDLVADAALHLDLLVPHEKADVIAALHREGNVTAVEYRDEGVELEVLLPARLAARYQAYVRVPAGDTTAPAP
jgi:GTP-binding protein HflX